MGNGDEERKTHRRRRQVIHLTGVVGLCRYQMRNRYQNINKNKAVALEFFNSFEVGTTNVRLFVLRVLIYNCFFWVINLIM